VLRSPQDAHCGEPPPPLAESPRQPSASSDIANSMRRLKSLQLKRAAERITPPSPLAALDQQAAAAQHAQRASPRAPHAAPRSAARPPVRAPLHSAPWHLEPLDPEPRAEAPRGGRASQRAASQRSDEASPPPPPPRGGQARVKPLSARARAAPPDPDDAPVALRRAHAKAEQAPRASAHLAPAHDDVLIAAPGRASSNDVFAALLAAELQKGGGGGIVDDTAGPLCQCGSCGRRFTAAALARHAKICDKVFVQKRKQFDMAGARLAGLETELVGGGKPKVGRGKAKPAAPPPPLRHEDKPLGKKPAWKQKSTALRNAMMQNK